MASLLSAFTIAFATGCTPTKPQSVHPMSTTNSMIPVAETVKHLSHPDGSIFSLTQYHVAGQNPYIKLYKMFYWSAGVKVEAFVSKPVDSGKYPLLLGCHGGYVEPLAKSHVSSPDSPSDLAQQNALYVDVEPLYRGYNGSGGTVQNVSQNTLDAENAITAAETFSDVQSHDVYVGGTSMGGEVALMLAERPDVKAVVAVSPFVGWSITGAWAMKNANQSALAVDLWQQAIDTYGPVNANAPIYKRESPDIAKIKAPVLILQGTADKNVPWQTVQIFVNDMKRAKKKVEFQLYPGGDHGLNSKYQKEKFSEVNTWFTEYGLNLY